MSMASDAFWEARIRQLQGERARRELELAELQQREQIFLERTAVAPLPASSDTSEAAPPDAAAVDVAALVAEHEAEMERARIAREVDVQRTSAFWLQRLEQQRQEARAQAEVATAPAPVEAVSSGEVAAGAPEQVAEEVAAAEAATAAALLQREVDVQKTAAFWLARLEEERAATAAAVAAAQEAARKEALLDAELDALEADYDVCSHLACRLHAALAAYPAPQRSLATARPHVWQAMTDRMEVMSETMTLVSGRLDAMDDAMEEAEEAAEINLQKTAAFWLARLDDERAKTAAAASEAESQRLLAELRLEQLTEAQAQLAANKAK